MSWPLGSREKDRDGCTAGSVAAPPCFPAPPMPRQERFGSTDCVIRIIVSMEQCVLVSGGGLGRQDRTAGKVPHRVSQPAPMSSPCFAPITREGAVLDAAPRDIKRKHPRSRADFERRASPGLS